MTQFQVHILDPFIAGSRDNDRERDRQDALRIHQQQADESRRYHDEESRVRDEDRMARLQLGLARENRLSMMDRAKAGRGATSSRLTALAGQGKLDAAALDEMGGMEGVDPDDLRQALNLQDSHQHRAVMDEALNVKMRADTAKKTGAVDAATALYLRGDLPSEAYLPTVEMAMGGQDPVLEAQRWKNLARKPAAAKGPSVLFGLSKDRAVLQQQFKDAEDPDEKADLKAQLDDNGRRIMQETAKQRGEPGPSPRPPRGEGITPGPPAPEPPGAFSRAWQGITGMFDREPGPAAPNPMSRATFIPSESVVDRRATVAGGADETAPIALATWYQGGREEPGVAVDRAVPMWMHAPVQSTQPHRMSDAQIHELAAWVGRMYPNAPDDHVGRMAYMLAKHYGWEVD